MESREEIKDSMETLLFIAVFILSNSSYKYSQTCIHSQTCMHSHLFLVKSTVKPAYTVTFFLSSLQSNLHTPSPFSCQVYSQTCIHSHLFLVKSENSYELNLFEEVTCLKRPPFLCLNGDLLVQVWLSIVGGWLSQCWLYYIII